MKKILKNIVKKVANEIILKGYEMAEQMWADGTVQEALEIADAAAAAMNVRDYHITILMPKWHEEAMWRAIEVGRLVNGQGGVTYPDHKQININLFYLGLLHTSWWRSNKGRKQEVLAEVKQIIVHELRHAKQFVWLDSHRDVRERVLANYKISAWSLNYWLNPMERDARRYSKTGEDVPFDEVFKDFI